MHSVWPFVIHQNRPLWAFWDKAFTPEECEEIIKIGTSSSLHKGTVTSKKDQEFFSVQSDIRISDVSWIFPTDETAWIFTRLTDIITSLNDEFFKFDLYGLVEGLQFTVYHGGELGKYDKHIDMLSNGIIRKLSISVQLSDENSYEGGDLNIYINHEPQTLSKDIGKLSLFPSYTMHEVMPVTSGTRYSLVAWVTGPPFK